MALHRRYFLQSALSAFAAAGLSGPVLAQSYPLRPVRLVAGYPPGSAADILARLIGQSLSERLGQPFVVENRVGAGNNIATEAVVHTTADGYTLLLTTSANAINATLYGKLNFNFIRDIAPVAGLARGPLVLVVNPSVPAKSVPELIALAKAQSGKLTLASSGNGTVAHVAGELFKMRAGVEMVHLPYRGSPPALADLVGGHVQALFDPMVSSVEFIKSGKWKVGEEKIGRQLGVDWLQGGDGFTWDSPDLDKSEGRSSAAWQLAAAAIGSGDYHLVVLDEITYPMNWGWIDSEAVIAAISSRPDHVNVIATGRDAPGGLIDVADTVTEMVNVRHAYDRGIRARRGIDF